MLLVFFISSSKEVAAVNSSEKDSRHFNEMSFKIFLIYFKGVLKMLSFNKS